jgi:anhydro-N-acetylmuramic acid kinase
VKSKKSREYIVLGTMSGTSLDGLDLAICRFQYLRNRWNYELLRSKTVVYHDKLRKQLENAQSLPGNAIINLDNEFGKFIALKSKEFIAETRLAVELISSHGHTVFHQPKNGITFQIGSGACIAAITGITTVTDFRRTDVALGGQGAPLVPAGDDLLFSEYDYCLNLGGFANISFRSDGKRVAYDICPVNIILNLLSQRQGKLFDNDGLLGSSGTFDINLYTKLNDLGYYKLEPPKSLGKEWIDRKFIPVLDETDLPEVTKMRTVYEHISTMIAGIPRKNKTVLITGGGIHNKFLRDLIIKYCKANCIIPADDIINYKEAIIFAFLGLLRIMNEINCYASVTGASRDSCCGVVNVGKETGRLVE